jgi:hypothetical protein
MIMSEGAREAARRSRAAETPRELIAFCSIGTGERQQSVTVELGCAAGRTLEREAESSRNLRPASDNEASSLWVAVFRDMPGSGARPGSRVISSYRLLNRSQYGNDAL